MLFLIDRDRPSLDRIEAEEDVVVVDDEQLEQRGQCMETDI